MWLIRLLMVLLAVAWSGSGAWAAANGSKIFEKRCSQCHDLPNPKKPPPEGWVKRLDLMAPMAGLSKKEKAEVLSYLLSHSKTAEQALSVAQERKIFEKKCSLCHSTVRIFTEKLTPESRRHIVLRMKERAPDWISPKDAEAILDFLQKAKKPVVAMPKLGPKPVKTAGLPPQEVFRARCSACHTLERVYLKLEEAGPNADVWTHIVSRMRKKNPEWISKRDAEKILTYLQSLRPVREKNK